MVTNSIFEFLMLPSLNFMILIKIYKFSSFLMPKSLNFIQLTWVLIILMDKSLNFMSTAWFYEHFVLIIYKFHAMEMMNLSFSEQPSKIISNLSSWSLISSKSCPSAWWTHFWSMDQHIWCHCHDESVFIIADQHSLAINLMRSTRFEY